MLAPGAPPLAGRERLDAAVRGGAAPSHEVTACAFERAEVEVRGDLALEWGRIEGAMRPAGSAEAPARLAYNVLRVLRREEGGWRVWRTIWNEAPAG